jgi:hypothetical protein
VAEITGQKTSEDKDKSYIDSGQDSGLPVLDKKTCLRCPAHCPLVKNTKGHWKNRLYDFLSAILNQLNAKNGGQELQNVPAGYIFEPEDLKRRFSRTPFVVEKIAEWIFQKCALGRLVKKARDICTKIVGRIKQIIKNSYDGQREL